MYASNHWETSLYCNVVYHWLATYKKNDPLILQRDLIFSSDVSEESGSVSVSDKTSQDMISWTIEAVGFGCKDVRLLWNLTDDSSALLSVRLSNFIRWFHLPITRLRLTPHWNWPLWVTLINVCIMIVRHDCQVPYAGAIFLHRISVNYRLIC